MPAKNVLVHICIRPERDNAQPLAVCDCWRKVKRTEARARVLSGHAAWKRCTMSDGRIKDDSKHLIHRGEPRGPKNARTISAFDIDRAFVEGVESERRRIAEYPSVS